MSTWTAPLLPTCKYMKQLFNILLLTAVPLLLSAQPNWLRKAAFYQVYPQSFKDSNGDGIGDLPGLTGKLDYIRGLGCNAIWLNPVFASPWQDAGYDVSDFKQVAARYGKNADLERLFRAAHRRGMKVCLDLVAGHTSDQHPWFKASAASANGPYADRFIWTNDRKVKPEKFVGGDFNRDGNFLKNFFDCQPALNYGYAHPDPSHPWEQPVSAEGPRRTLAALKDIIRFWMDKGADGFRVDMASSLIKNDSGFVATNRLWQGIRKWFSARYPQGVLIAEWSNPEQSARAGFMIDFMIHFNVPGYPSLFFNRTGVFRRDTCYFNIDGKGSAAEFVRNYTHQLAATAGRSYVAVPTANHDFQRPNAGTRNTIPQLRTVMAFLLTLKGIPFVYYGDEIGMRYQEHLPNKEGSLLWEGANRAGSRTPMQWDKHLRAGFSNADTAKFYLPLDLDPARPNVSSQLLERGSLYHFTHSLLKLRQTVPALGNEGAIRFLNTGYPLVYERSLAGSRYLVVIDPAAGERQLTLAVKGRPQALLQNGLQLSGKNQQLTIVSKGIAYGIFKL